MTVKVILDTDILSEYLKGHNAAVAGRAAGYAKDHGVFTFTSVTVYEIVYGLELKGASSQLNKVKAWLKKNEEITNRRRLYCGGYHQVNGEKAGFRRRTPRLFDCLGRGATESAAGNG
jgi:predicted nucleic acid-binding protein